MKTADIDSITNSLIQAMDKELRKHGITMFTSNHDEYRTLIQTMVSVIVLDHQRSEKKGQITEEVRKLLKPPLTG